MGELWGRPEGCEMADMGHSKSSTLVSGPFICRASVFQSVDWKDHACLIGMLRQF